MGKGRAVCFVVVLIRGGIKLYFKREEVGEIGENGEVIKESRGWFTPDLLEARKFLDKSLAEVLCSGFKGAHIETIKTGEILKSDRK